MEGFPAIFPSSASFARLRALPAETPFHACADLPAESGMTRMAACGPFQSRALPPPGGWAWYVNDFTLSDTAPWRVPAEVFRVSPESVPAPPDGPVSRGPAGTFPALPPVAWMPADRPVFQDVFRSVMQRIDARSLLKLVPVSVQTGRFLTPLSPAALQAALHPHRIHGMGHAVVWCGEDDRTGFAAITPEVLFEVEGSRLTTMALAGTADAEHESDLRHRPKLAREHEIVVDELHRRLASLGRVKITGREVVTFGTVKHLRTRLCVDLPAPPEGDELNKLVHLLHPTPALGVSPQTPETLDLLHRCRERCGVPRHFGAPFGVAWPGGAVFFVAIRGIFWENDRLSLPAGGGLVTGSELETEWEEQELKRAWVRHAFGLNEPATAPA